MKLYTYLQLSEKAKEKARRDYYNGWLETHKKNDLCWNDAFKILCTNEDLYDENGNFIKEKTK